ncbi:MAG: right-handed parallel beta-helix repeat-containing protein [Ardenticatenaceae bacterium]|nr:right-handed parallel beta-helix repeat-containing protein [Ardenticatenaceae bacterium]
MGQNSWQTWNPLTGKWWASGAPGNSLCPQSSPCTTAQVLTTWPNTGLRSDDGFLWFKAGGPWSSGFDGNVDAFTIGVNGVETTYDFEPETLCTTTCYVNAATGNDAFGGDTPGSAKKTIQAAVNQVLAGGTVIVAAGTYNESVVIDKSLTLQSSTGAASTIINGNSATENYYMVSIEADNVTLDGFTITNPLYNASADASGVVTNLGKSNIRITNNIIHDIGTSTRSPVSFGTFGINVGPVNGLEIDHNTIYSIKNSDASSWAMGIFVWGNDTNDTAKSINIHDNVIHDITNPSNFNDGINAGGDSANVVISNNTISAPIKRGIATNAFMDGDASITNNLVSGASSYGILLRSPFAQSVTCNTVTGSGIGIQVNDTSAAPTINYNNIVGNTTSGLKNLSTNSVNAENNWWGAADGPSDAGSGSGDAVSANVDFDPYLANPSTCAPGDFVGPTITLVASPNPAPLGNNILVLADLDDRTTGNSTIVSAAYAIDGGIPVAANAKDGWFDSPFEQVEVTVVTPTEPDVLEICISATDEAGNTSTECLLLVWYDPDGGFVTGGGWIDSPPGAMSISTDVVLSGPLADAGWGGNFVRDTSVVCDPNSTPITLDGWVALDNLTGNGALLIGLVDKQSIDQSNSGSFEGAYAYFARRGTGATTLTVGPSDGNAGGGEYVQTFAEQLRDPWENVRVNFSAEIFNGQITVTFDGHNYVDSYGDVVATNSWSEFEFGAYPAVDLWSPDGSVDYQVTVSGCEARPTGKATFGFVSKYQKGANIPSGQTEFQFKAGNLNFHSSSYEWLVVNQNDSNAQFKGSGTINGDLAPNGDDYKFMLWAGDGSPDTFRIKIWWEDTNGEHVVYDNGVPQAIGGGSIVIHKK